MTQLAVIKVASFDFNAHMLREIRVDRKYLACMGLVDAHP